MGKLRAEISVSLDGYVAGPEQSEEDPLGIGGEALHEWIVKLPAFNDAHGRPGEGEGSDSPSNAVVEESRENIGANIMGRNMFGPVRGEWGEDPWRGWWGEEPPFQGKVFVLTHYEREPLVLEDGSTFVFVTDGIESALEQAKAAAGEADVLLSGGGSAIRQYLKAGLVDELNIHIAPVILGGGIGLFDNLEGADVSFEALRTVHAPDVTHIKYRVS